MDVAGMDMLGGRPAYRIVSSAKTNKATDLIFKVRDFNESWIDAASLCSLRFKQDVQEGFYRRKTETTYHHPEGRYDYWKFRKEKQSTKQGEIPAFVQDILSSLYFLRTQELVPGDSYAFEANSGGKTWPLMVHVEGVDAVKVPAGKFECYRVRPDIKGEGLFNGKGRLTVWMTKDESKIPVLLRSRVAVGAFDAEMTDYAGPARSPAQDGPVMEAHAPSQGFSRQSVNARNQRKGRKTSPHENIR